MIGVGGLVFGVWGLGSRVEGFGFGVLGSSFRVFCLGPLGFGFCDYGRIPGPGLKNSAVYTSSDVVDQLPNYWVLGP